MNESKKSIIIVIIAVVVLAGLIYLVQRQRAEKPKPKETPKIEIPGKPIVAPQEVGAGKVGETEETFKGEEVATIPGEAGGFVEVPLPPVISNAFGQIKEIKKDYLILAGDGQNFADRKPRDLKAKFTESSITFAPGQTKQYPGLDGLKYLKVGDNISCQASENIRGKTEFEVSYINKL